MRHFSITFYSQYRHELHSAQFDLIRVEADWHLSDAVRFAHVSLGLIGFVLGVTYWPDGVSE